MKRFINILPVSIIIISLILSGIQGVKRFSAEQSQKDVQILVTYNDIKKATEIYGKPLEEVLVRLKEAGVGGVLIKEQTIKSDVRGNMVSWEEQGEVTVFSGTELMLFEKIADTNFSDINPSHYYLWVPDERIRDSIQKHIEYKLGSAPIIEINNQLFIDAGASSNNLFTIGTGYPTDDLEIIANEGFLISPQVRAWPNVTEDALKFVLNDVDNIPNLGTVYFNDVTVPGHGTDTMKDFAKNHKIGIVEFFSEKQKGLYSLIRAGVTEGRYNSIRLHTLADGETSTLTPERVIDRYLLAATERNLKALLVKMPATDQPDKDYEDWYKIVSRIHQALSNKGYKISSDPEPVHLPSANPVFLWLIGLGPIFLLVLFGRWIDKEKWAWLLAAAAFMAWTGLLFVRPILARQLMALAAAILYPTWAVISCISEKKKTWKELFIAFIKVCLFSFGGALTIIGLLSESSFVLTIDLFRGAKVAHIFPLLLVPLLIEYKRGNLKMKKIKDLSFSPVTYLALFVLGILGLALIIYVLRTGNEGPKSSYEAMIRNLLNKMLGVRPRTKEFLIGHPLMLVSLYYGYKEKYFPVLLGAVIGQISIVNTYAHIHTPIMISLIRTFHGIWIGFLGGIILIFVLKGLEGLGRRWGLWEV